MPFHSLYGKQYEGVMRSAIESVWLKCVRGDEIYTRQAIVQDIWASIRTARVVVAELSGRNPNVMYEVGLAHAIGKPIILLTRNEEVVPFDLKGLRYVFYDTNDPDWGTHLRNELARALSRVLENQELVAHLDGVDVLSTFPLPPLPLAASIKISEVSFDLSGVWRGQWLSVKREREHRATLVIPIQI